MQKIIQECLWTLGVICQKLRSHHTPSCARNHREALWHCSHQLQVLITQRKGSSEAASQNGVCLRHPIFFLGDDEEAGKGCEEWLGGGGGGLGLDYFCLCVFGLVFLVGNGGGDGGNDVADDFLVCIFFLGKKIETSLAPRRQQLDINDRQNHYFLSPLLLRWKGNYHWIFIVI